MKKEACRRYHLMSGIFTILLISMLSACISPGKGDELGPGSHRRTLVQAGIERQYTVHVPPTYDKSKPAPLIIFLHGGGGGPLEPFVDGIDKYMDKRGYILVAPAGTDVAPGGSWLFSKAWNGGTWAGGQCCGSADDVGFVYLMIDDLKAQLNISEGRVFAMGISNGGLMANRLGCELSDRIAAIATVAPAAVPSGCRPMRPMPVLDIHGTGDPCNPFDGGEPTLDFCAKVPYKRMSPKEVVAQWVQVNGCSKKTLPGYKNGTVECAINTGCRDGADVEFCKVQGMGHTWPFGAQYLPPRQVGPVSNDISTDQILDFFDAHPMR